MAHLSWPNGHFPGSSGGAQGDNFVGEPRQQDIGTTLPVPASIGWVGKIVDMIWIIEVATPPEAPGQFSIAAF